MSSARLRAPWASAALDASLNASSAAPRSSSGDADGSSAASAPGSSSPGVAGEKSIWVSVGPPPSWAAVPAVDVAGTTLPAWSTSAVAAGAPPPAAGGGGGGPRVAGGVEGRVRGRRPRQDGGEGEERHHEAREAHPDLTVSRRKLDGP